MNERRVYICPVHGVVAESEVAGAEIYDCKKKKVRFVLEHVPGDQSKCFRKVKSICIKEKLDEVNAS